MDKMTLRIRPVRQRMAVVVTAVTLLLTGCTPTRLLTNNEAANAPAVRDRTDNPLAVIAQPNANHTDFTTRMAADLAYGDHVLTVKGNLRMRRGDVIQMAFTALGMVEIARVELTPKGAWFIDRMSKQYAVVEYDQLPGMNGVDLSYDMLESLLWNELFLPGQKKIASHLNLFESRTSGQQLIITPKSQPTINLRFAADNDCTRLQQTRLEYGPVASTWNYSAFQSVGNARFPAMLKATLEDGSHEVSATLTYTGMAFDNTDWTAHTNIANYTQLTIEDFIQKLAILK